MLNAKQNRLNIFPTAVVNERDRIRQEKFRDSFFYATETEYSGCIWMRDIKENGKLCFTYKEEEA